MVGGTPTTAFPNGLLRGLLNGLAAQSGTVARCARPSAAMARAGFHPLLAVPRSAGRGAGGQRSMPASCSDSLPLFERRERSERSEFGSAAPRPSIAGCPEGDTASGAAFSLPTFFWRSKRK